jgi:hypothetical protein
MLYFDGVFGLIMLAVWLFCIIDVITTDPADCRNLPKLVWLFIVILLADLGSIAWLIAGRPWSGNASQNPTYRGNKDDRYPEYDRPGRFTASNPDDDEQFLGQLRDRAEQQRRAYRRQREQELAEEQRKLRERPSSGDDPEVY